MKKFRIAIVLFLVFFTGISFSQIFQYSNDLSGNYASIDANCTATPLSRVNGLTSTTSCADGFISYKYSTPSTWTTNRTATQFTISPNTHFQLQVTSIKVDVRRNNKGPQKYRIAYSTDGGMSWINNGTDYSLTTYSTCGSMTSFTWDVPDFTAINSVIVRIYGFNAVNGTGICQIKNIVVNGSVNYVDEDGDGFTYDVDCNDMDFNINPSVTEICNAIDDNCNISVDEGLEYFDLYLDSDLDGYGNSEITINTCFTMIPGYSPISGDCDDLNPTINDDAAEIENGLDDDCDGVVDTTFYETGYEIGIFFKSKPALENTENAILLFPNPAVNVIHIQLENSISSTTQISIYALNGNLFYSDKIETNVSNFEIHLNEFFTNGFYYLELKDANLISKKVFCVQK